MLVRVGIWQGDLVGDTDVVIQQAIAAVSAYGGGTVKLGPGTYTLHDSVRLASNTRLLGSGQDTVLRKCDGAASPVTIDADYGQCKVTVAAPSGFRVGMGVMVKDDESSFFADSLARISSIQGSVLYLDRMLIWDYTTEKQCTVSCTFSPIVCYGVRGATVEGLVVDGNRQHNREINGCIGAGIFLRESTSCRILNCTVRDFAGDGIDTEITQAISIEDCEATGMSGYGIHLGAGSARPIVRGNKCVANDSDGMFLCWRVQDGVFESNEIKSNGQVGISIGHKDTDNLFLDNTVSSNGSHGICFRREKPSNAGSRNTLRGNVIEDNRGCGIYIEPATSDLVIEGNTIRDTRCGASRTQQAGVCAREGTSRIRVAGNNTENHLEGDIQGSINAGDG